MSEQVLITAIASFPGVLAAVLAYLGRRAVKRSVGNPGSVPLSKLVEDIAHKIDWLVESQMEIRERLARLEGERGVLHPPFRGRPMRP